MSESFPGLGKVPNRALYGWGVGGFVEFLMSSTVSILLVPVFTTAFHLDPVLVGWAVMIPRLLDAISDVLMGYISDRTRSRWGRRKPYIFVGAWLGAGLSVVLWWASPSWGQWTLFIWVTAVNTLFWTAYTIFSVPLGALGYELTDDYNERTRISAVRTFFCTLPGLFTGWLYWLSLLPVFGGEIHGVRVISMVLAVVVVAVGVIPVLTCQERFQAAPRDHLGFMRSIGETFGNRYFLAFLGIRLSMALGIALFNGLVFFLSLYYVCGGDKVLATKLAGIGGTLYTVLSFPMILAGPFLGRTLGKKQGLCAGLGALTLVACAQPFILRPDHPWLILLQPALSAPVMTLTSIFMGSFLPDICDLDELETGKRREGLFCSVDKLVYKLEFSFVALASGYLLNLAGYDAGAAVQSDAFTLKLRWLAYTPNIVCPIVAFLIAWHFPINHRLMTTVRETLAARRARGEAV